MKPGIDVESKKEVAYAREAFHCLHSEHTLDYSNPHEECLESRILFENHSGTRFVDKSIMKKPLFSAPDSFSIAPLLMLLPVRGSVAELEKLTASLFARYEKARAHKKALGPSSDRESQRRVAAEEVMLKHVLEWLSVSTEGDS